MEDQSGRHTCIRNKALLGQHVGLESKNFNCLNIILIITCTLDVTTIAICLLKSSNCLGKYFLLYNVDFSDNNINN